MTKPAKRTVKAWAIYRNGKFYRAYVKQSKRLTAKEHCQMLIRNLKSARNGDKYRVVPVIISEVKR